MLYHMTLTGYVGGADFCSREVRKVLDQYPGKHVDIMICSPGGSLAEGLAICGAFRDHGDVTVHLRGLNASAATIASMGAKHIEIAPESMYLIHQVSVGFFDWASRNAGQISDFITQLEKTKADLDTMDSSVAALYASKCRKPVKDMIDLMRAEKWISAQQALEWGFVDEISNDPESGKTSISVAQAEAFKALGLPLPPVEIEPVNRSFLSSISDTVTQAVRRLLSHDNNTMTDNQNTPPAAQTAQQPAAQTAQQTQAADHTDAGVSMADILARMEAQEKEIADLKSRVPGSSTSEIRTAPVQNASGTQPATPLDSFITAQKEAVELFNSIP